MQDWKAAIRTWEQRVKKVSKNKEDEIIERFLNEEE